MDRGENDKTITKEVKQVAANGSLQKTDNVYMSNNLSPYMVWNIAPNQARSQGVSQTLQTNKIVALTGNTIQLDANLNVGGTPTSQTSYTFQYQNQSIYPYKIYDIGNLVTARASVIATRPTLGINFATGNGDVAFVDTGVTFNTNNSPGYILDLNGSINITQNVTVSGNINITGTVSVQSIVTSNMEVRGGNAGIGNAPAAIAGANDSLSVAGNIETNSNVFVNQKLLVGTTSIAPIDSHQFYVSGSSSLQGDVVIGSITNPYALTVYNTLNVDGSANMTNIAVSSSANIANLVVSGSTILDGSMNVTNLVVSGNARVDGSMNVANLVVSGNAAVDGSMNIADLVVSGNARVDGSMNVADIYVRGNATIKGLLDVSNAIIHGFADISGAANISGNLNFNIYQERIVYQSGTYNNSAIVPTNAPGYWSAIGNVVNLRMPQKPAIYILDGSASQTDISLNLIPVAYAQPVGMAFYFVAENTTNGHMIKYDYNTVPNTYTSILAAPLNMTLLRIGANIYSSSI